MQAVDDPQDSGPGDLQYYGNSIKDFVQQKYNGMPLAYKGITHRDRLPLPAFTLGSNIDEHEKTYVHSLNFLMWVSPPHPTPDQMKEQIHRYTEVQCHHLSSQPVPLESTKNWRGFFPHLVPVVESATPLPTCDIIMLEASFRLMPDFPPASCKLGINLELDFRQPTMANMGALTEMHQWRWICITRMYEHGRCFRESRHQCDIRNQKLDIGTVAPSFESTYWASKFVKLIEKKRSAEDLRDENAILAADEKSRQFFGELTAMQELTAFSPADIPLLGTQARQPPGKRMAILLWKFSQARQEYVGTTTWQRLVPPPHRNTMNSPPAHQDMSLPPLAMDAMVDGFQDDTSFASCDGPHSQQSQHGLYHFYDTDIDDSTTLTGHNGYNTGFKDEDLASFAAMQSSFDMPASQGDLAQASFQDLEHFPFHFQPHELELGQHEPPNSGSNNFFEIQEGQQAEAHQHDCSLLAAPQMFQDQDLAQYVTTDEAHRHPLDDFDHNTHRMLQAQLEQHKDHNQDSQDGALRAVLAAASAMSDLGAQSDSRSIRPQRQHANGYQQNRYWDIPYPPRPLLSHHSPSHEPHIDPKNRETFNANQMAAALVNHDSGLALPHNDFDHHLSNQVTLDANDGQGGNAADVGVVVQEATVKAEGVRH